MVQTRRKSSGGSDDFGLEHALRFSFKLLGYRQRSVQELAGRLKLKGFAGDVAEAALAKLSGMGYLNDEALAKHLRLRAEDGKMLGRSGAKAFLGRLGIPRQLTEEALVEYDESAGAESLVRKKLGSMRGLPDETVKRRILSALRRRGFSGETIRSAMRKIEKEDLSE